MSVRLEYRLTFNNKYHARNSLDEIQALINTIVCCGHVSKSTVAQVLKERANKLSKDASTFYNKENIEFIRKLMDIAEAHNNLYAPVWTADRFLEQCEVWDMSDPDAQLKAVRHAVSKGGELSIVTVQAKTRVTMELTDETTEMLMHESRSLGLKPEILVENALSDYFAGREDV